MVYFGTTTRTNVERLANKMIYVTGDTHCPTDIHKLNTANFPQQKDLTKDDTLIICGDVGIVWERDSGEDRFWQNWLNDKNCTIVFCDGNHENFDLLYGYPIVEWNGGKVHQIKDSVFHLMRGEVYTIEGKTFFVLGGAMSLDKEYRTEGKNWWSQETPSPKELNNAFDNLEKCGWKVDYVITHDAPSRVVGQLGFAPHNIDDTDIMRFYRFLDFIAVHLKFQCWYFGHFHKDVPLEAYDKEFVGVNNEVRPIINNCCLTLDELIMSFTKG